MSYDTLGAFALLCFSSLLAVLNPLSVAPIYLSLTDGYTRANQLRTLRTAITTGGVVLIFFSLLGGTLFQLFGITLEAFRIAGGVILFGIGIDMLQAKQSRVRATPEEEEEGLQKEDVAITPLGIPLIVGPGSITTVMVLTGSASTTWHLVVLFLAIVTILGIVFTVLAMAPRIVARVGQTGLNVMTRIMGLLLTVIGVQFIIDGAQPVLAAIL
ncbi:MAG TPA: NAAT family transporter, partial [Gemmatimonadaceae bacterium]|nr:NAAT family transporter [Gemmatimonadaceae bacterium]